MKSFAAGLWYRATIVVDIAVAALFRPNKTALATDIVVGLEASLGGTIRWKVSRTSFSICTHGQTINGLPCQSLYYIPCLPYINRLSKHL